MAVSLNSVVSFNPIKLQSNYQQVTRTITRALLLKVPSGAVGLRHCTQPKRSKFYLLATSGDNIATETTDKDSKTTEGLQPDNGLSDDIPNVNSSEKVEKIESSDASDEKSSSTVKRAPLTARERLRAARVLNRYTEPKPSKPELGSKLLEALRETDKGKRRPGLPEAPTNMLDDSKRGLSKGGWSIDLPGGMDVYVVIFSFVFISTVMFATTYLVWKVGAIHFND
ncbi:hypothetical protein BUALT_Bualt06G0058300 [Buddleja alternifolia]|uniref:Uncharacterized protein n=1 Tax=Buddleja alternifolia TaxID=168488 RepID=A0AAV6XHI3_9LAMI|nr:hypothetical protein BUALT_Bualt06G0058300 [Buddleja alternifolia]